VHEYDRLRGLLRARFDRRGDRAARLHVRVPQLAHRALAETPSPLAAEGCAARGAVARRESDLRAATASASGIAVSIMRAGPMLRVPNAPMMSAKRSFSVAARNSRRSAALSFRPPAKS